MKTITALRFQNSFTEVLDMLKDGESLAVTSRGKVVAILTRSPRRAIAAKAWSDLDVRFGGPVNSGLNMAELISEGRGV